MSFGIVYCSKCKMEVHQDGPNQTWRHCEDKSPQCDGAVAAYPNNTNEIIGKWCGRDDV